MRVRFVLCGILVLATTSLGAGSGDRMTMQVTPAVAMAPADLTVRMVIAADARNRSIEVIAESDDFYRSSEMPMAGAEAPRTTQFAFRGLPGGLYTVAAVLKGANEEPLAQIRREVNVVANASAR